MGDSEPSTIMSDIKVVEFENIAKERPHMFLGNTNRTINLLCGMIREYIQIGNSDKIFVTLTIAVDNKFSLQICPDADTALLIERVIRANTFLLFYFRCLAVFANELTITNSIGQFAVVEKKLMAETLANAIISGPISFDFEVNTVAIRDAEIDYQALCGELLQLAVLNRSIEILVKDTRKKHLSQNYLHVSEGVFYLFDHLKSQSLGTPKFDMRYDGELNSKAYQVAICHRTDWYPALQICSFANDVHNQNGGDLVDGVLDGIMMAFKKYFKAHGLATYKVKRKELMNGLILVCAVRGGEFNYGGSFKETLENTEVRNDVKAIISQAFYDTLEQNAGNTNDFLFRFDKSRFPSSLY